MRMVQRHGTPFLLLFAGIAIGFFLSAHWVPNVSAVGPARLRKSGSIQQYSLDRQEELC